jgi:hypothetical protein
LTSNYFFALVAICVVLSLIALVGYVVGNIRPSWFRLSVVLARIISFNVEMGSRGRDSGNVTDEPEQGLLIRRLYIPS